MSAPTRPRAPAWRIFATLIATDVRNVTRDGLLAFIILAPLLVALVFRWFVPEVETLFRLLTPYLGAELASRIAHASGPLLMSLLVAIAPGLVGAVYGLLLVDERDERTLVALRVMPIAFAHYMAARLATPLLLSTAVTIAAFPLAGLLPMPLGVVAALACVSATSAPLIMLAMGAFAPDKVAALAIMRVLNAALALPLLAYFATPPILYLAWLTPSYWQMKALWLAADGAPFWGALALALALNLALTWWLYVCFERRGED